MALCFTPKTTPKFHKSQTSYGLFSSTEIKNSAQHISRKITEDHLLNGKCLIRRQGSKISVENQNTNLSTEARINFGKLPESPAKAISLQNLHSQGHIETVNIKRGYVIFSRSEFSVSPVRMKFPNKLVYK